MRLIHTFHQESDANTFATFLARKGIETQMDVSTNTDWGSNDYGTITANLWIMEEDQLDEASVWLEQYLDHPDDPQFVQQTPATPKRSLEEKPKEQEKKPFVTLKPMAQEKKIEAIGPVTLYLIIGCTLLFFLGEMTTRPYESPPPTFPLTPLYASPINKALYFDYPLKFEILDKFIKAYGFDQLFTPAKAPSEGRFLLQKSAKTPYWRGFYGKIVEWIKDRNKPITVQAPLFEKIQQGEIWRLFSPCVLHNDIFHLFFNMIWLLVLGRQLESKLKIPRYLIFIVLTGVFSNIAQYLMSGANFIGFSGVICAMITFVWFRQKYAPWEGYQLLPATMAFITIFVLMMFAIQLVSFFIEIQGQSSIVPMIANTAHLSGALAGFILSRINFFAWKPKA